VTRKQARQLDCCLVGGARRQEDSKIMNRAPDCFSIGNGGETRALGTKLAALILAER
jgi:hypothetical protein